jgi:hypothetical protein
MDLKEIGFDDVNWIHVVQNRVQWWALVTKGGEVLDHLKKDSPPCN